jgi:acyl-CoA hydrolase
VDNFTIVRPEHLNHHGVLFGGQLLLWVDENAWLVAARDFPGYRLVTRAMERAEFRTPVPNGAILRFQVLPSHRGESSVTYAVDVFADEPGGSEEKHVFSNHVTFVSVDESGRKRALPACQRLKSEG